MTEQDIAAIATKSQQIHRLELVFPNEEAGRVNDWLYANGYSVKRGGPYTDREMFPKCDPKRQLCIAEKVIRES